MKKKDELKIDALTGIEDRFIDKVSAKRYSLLTRKKAHKWMIPSVAAAILVAIMIPILLLVLIKQVPVYEGMTVLNSYNGALSASIEPTGNQNGFEFLSDKKDNNGNGNNGNHYGNNKKPVDEIIEEDTSVEIDIPDQQMYYAQANQDLYIKVHISNPDSFEILSFTLNGKKYSSYMFEEGSDMENLILKVNVGDAEGVIEYTIDAIKYVDGTKIKDVIMEGDRTVRVGVYSHKQPTATIKNEFIGINEVSFTADLSDTLDLIELCGGKAYAFICDNVDVVDFCEISLGENKIEFSELKTGTEYRYGVFAYYDTLDGEGMRKCILFEKSITTRALVAMEEPEVDQEKISFKISFDELYKEKKLSAMALYLGEDIVKEFDVSGDVTKQTFIADSLLSNNEYRIVITYKNLGATETVEFTLKTEAKATPDFTLSETEKTQTSFKFDVAVTDTDAVGAITKMELIHGEKSEIISDLTTREFNELLSNNDYTVRVTYTYDLNDGVGVQTLSKELTLKTEAKVTPDFTLTETEKTQTSFKFDVTVTDTDEVGAITKMELIHGEKSEIISDLTTREFNELLSNNDYTVRVTYTYDLNDGVGKQTLVKELTVRTEAKATPDFTLTETEKTQTSFKFNITATDVDNVGAITKIELIHGEDATNVEDLETRELTELLSNNDYTVRVTYTYDLNDGVGNQTLVKELTVKTKEKLEPTFTINDLTSETYTVNGSYDQTNVDNTLISYNVSIFKGEELVKENTDKKIAFDALNYYTEYTVTITYTFDVNDGKGVQTKTVEHSVKTLPYLDVESIISRNNSAVFNGDTIYVQANIINPNGSKVTHIDINGKKYAVSSASTATQLFVGIVCDETLGGGNVELKIGRIYADLEDTSYEIGIDSEASATVFVNTPLELLNVEFVNESYEPIYWRFPDEKHYVKFTVSNLAGYEITKIDAWGREIDLSHLIKISDSEYVIDAELSHFFAPLNIGATITIYGQNQYVSNSYDTFEFTQNLVTLQSNEIKYISTADEFIQALYTCGDIEWSKYYYKLTADIDLSGKSWDITNFCGVIDGDGYSIKNYTTTGYARNFGLIRELYGGIINLNMENSFVMVNNSTDVDMMAGMFAMWNKGLIQNCTIDNNTVISVTGLDGFIGGFAGRNYGTIENCTNNANVSAYMRYGAIALEGDGTIKNCVNNGNITSYLAYGIASSGIIQDCVNNGNLEDCDMAFGIADDATIQNCTNNGDILNCGSSYGIARKGTLENCDNYGMIRTCDRLEERTTLIGVGGDINRNCNNYGELIYVTSEPQWYEEEEIPSLFDSFGEDAENCYDYGAHYFNDRVIKEATTPPNK